MVPSTTSVPVVYGVFCLEPRRRIREGSDSGLGTVWTRVGGGTSSIGEPGPRWGRPDPSYHRTRVPSHSVSGERKGSGFRRVVVVDWGVGILDVHRSMSLSPSTH